MPAARIREIAVGVLGGNSPRLSEKNGERSAEDPKLECRGGVP